VCISETAHGNGSFSWVDFANSSGRLDVIARCAQIILSEPMFTPILTKATFILAHPNPPLKLELNLEKPYSQKLISEFQIAQDIKKLLLQNVKGNRGSFFRLRQGGFEDYLEDQKTHNQSTLTIPTEQLLFLEEEGTPIGELKEDLLSSTVIIGDQNGFSNKTLDIVRKHQGKSISLGKNSYLSSQCLFLILFETLKRTKTNLETHAKI
jgi:tRNA pseudouridine-54 N-methylase